MPVARPVMGDCSNYNGSAIHMQWTPVPDDREHMKGRVMGYKVIMIIDDNQGILLLISSYNLCLVPMTTHKLRDESDEHSLHQELTEVTEVI